MVIAERQIDEGQRKEIARASVMPGSGRDTVGRFYDNHPYPPPLTDLSRIRNAWSESLRRRSDYHLFWPNRTYTEARKILVAGCGTSQAAQYAVRFPHARVVGIDISEGSLHHTLALKESEGLTNLSVRQLAIEDVHLLGEQFDKIICTGVLHHLPVPDVGLQALRGVLKPTGAMHLMVYARYGRTGVYMLQEYAHRLGIGTSDSEIEDLVAVLRELPDGHPLVHLLRHAPDFRRKAALADALLNPLDRAYTVPEFYDFLTRNGMKMGRWLHQAPYLPQVGILASTPHAQRLASLPVREQHAAVELFRGTMVRHSAVVYRDDGAIQQPTFAKDGRWLDYVPLRVPQTVVVEERLPPGAVAVLINRSHTFSDIYLPMDVQQKRIFDAIDGMRTIAEIVAQTQTPVNDSRRQRRCGEFFERLWHYDQVVFDLSHAEGGSATD